MNNSIKLSGKFPYELKRLQYRWATTCWTERDINRVYKKISKYCIITRRGKLVRIEPIEFNDAEMLSYLLDESLDCKLYWTIKRLVQDDKIVLYPSGDNDGFWGIEPLIF